MKKDLASVFRYFDYFSYTPSFDEIYTFFPRKISKKALRSLLTNYELPTTHYSLQPTHYNLLTTTYPLQPTHSSYTLPQYSIPVKNKRDRTIHRYIQMLKKISLVRFVGVTGASAMRGLREEDDLDLCIVTKHDMLWTTRFIVVFIAKILGIHNQKGVCINLYFDEADLVIPQKKHNSYIAHELLQMKPIIDKDGMYQRFLYTNRWLLQYYPNAFSVIPTNVGIQSKIINLKKENRHLDSRSCPQCSISLRSRRVHGNDKQKNVMRYTLHEHVFKSLQLPIIHRNHTSFYITPTQLWLFKNDFEKKLKRRGLVI